MSAGGGASARQWTVFAVVVAGHLGALFLAVVSHHRPIRENTAEWSMQVVFISQSEDSEPSAKKPTRKTMRALHGRATHAAPSVPSAPLEGTPPRISDQGVNAITDWDAVAHDAADAVLRREREKAEHHSFEHAFPTPPAPHKPGIFGSQKENQRAGRVEEDGTRFWVTDNCYFDVPRGTPPSRMAGEFHLLTRTCKPPPTGGGDRMFEDLTPDYLRRLPAAQPSK
jgi:hypothetical protein